MNGYRSPHDNPGTVRDYLYGLYRDLIPDGSRARFFAILDSDAEESAQWLLDTLDALDALLHDLQPLPQEFVDARGELRRASLADLCRDLINKEPCYDL